MRYITTTGIVLQKKSVGEQDQFITFYSPELGKIHASAKGARRINSSFTGHLEVLNICDFQLYKKTHHYTITQCQLRHSFRKVRDTFDLTMLSFLLVEIFQRITQEGDEQSSELFELLYETLTKMEQGSQSELYLASFKIKILKLAGALPDITRCGNCHRRWEPSDAIFTDPEGHITCEHCAPQGLTPVPFNTMKLIHHVATTEYRNMPKILLSRSEADSFKKITALFLHNYIASDLKSEKVLMNL